MLVPLLLEGEAESHPTEVEVEEDKAGGRYGLIQALKPVQIRVKVAATLVEQKDTLVEIVRREQIRCPPSRRM
jgi:hypothetical protein